MKNNKTAQAHRDERIRYCQIWLIGNRCDGWEKQGMEQELKTLTDIKSFI